MFTGIQFGDWIRDISWLHQEKAKTKENAFRKFDGVTPFGIHPTLAATLVLHEETLPEGVRIQGFKALLAHDLWEDTDIFELPKWCHYHPDACDLIQELTFTRDEDPSVEIWNRSHLAKLFKFYDVTTNLMCVGKMAADRVKYRRQQAEKHFTWVETHYPELEIVKIARGLLGL